MNFPNIKDVNMSINTGEPRNVVGHIVSGAVAGAIVSSALNYKKVKSKQMEAKDAVKDTVKMASQGAIATGSAIATANYIGQKNGVLKALTAASVGMMGIYALEVLDDKLSSKYSFCDTPEENIIEANDE